MAKCAKYSLPQIETMIRLLEDCWQYVHEPIERTDAEKVLAEAFPA
jgi:hypothetical protein